VCKHRGLSINFGHTRDASLAASADEVAAANLDILPS
jgi:hypothetical protein